MGRMLYLKPVLPAEDRYVEHLEIRASSGSFDTRPRPPPLAS